MFWRGGATNVGRVQIRGAGSHWASRGERPYREGLTGTSRRSLTHWTVN